MQSKKDLSERDICTKYITPAIKAAGWNVTTRIKVEVTFYSQKDIVEKVTQLMSLCDQLEQHITDSQHLAEDLMKSLVREVVEV